MSAEEIQDAQGPLGGWERPSRRFAANGADPPPKWSDFADPIDAISGALRQYPRAREAVAVQQGRSGAHYRFSASAKTPTGTSCASAIRDWSAAIIRTRTAATASHEGRLGEVIEAYQLLRKSAALA